eukprot:gene19836-26527_t
MTLIGGIEYEGLMPYSSKGSSGVHGPEHRLNSGKAVISKKLKVGLLDESVVRLDGCDLGAIPEEVFQKTRLRELVLSRNRISLLSPRVVELRSLQVLRLDRNLLTTVPPELGKLSGLKHLDLSNNQINGLPVELGLCLELTNLNLLDNPLGETVPDNNAEDPKTFLLVYLGGTSAAQVNDLSQREVVVKKGTVRLLAQLRDQLDPEQHGEVVVRIAAQRQQEVRKRLKALVDVADAVKLEKALQASEKCAGGTVDTVP